MFIVVQEKLVDALSSFDERVRPGDGTAEHHDLASQHWYSYRGAFCANGSTALSFKRLQQNLNHRTPSCTKIKAAPIKCIPGAELAFARFANSQLHHVADCFSQCNAAEFYDLFAVLTGCTCEPMLLVNVSTKKVVSFTVRPFASRR